MAKIRYDRVTKIYPEADAPAIQEVSFEIEPGNLVILLGPSGCGKTTLLKMTNRLYEPSSGAISMDGLDIRQIEKTELRRRMGYVIQQVGLFPHMTVAENIAVVPKLLKWERPRIEARIEELLTLVNLPARFRDRYPSQISGGQQQRVGLARALAADPEILLMDEPFGAIDAINRYSLQTEMIHLQSKLQKTILFVTHDVEEALRLADRIAVLRDGRLEQFAEPCTLLTRPANDFISHLLNADDRIRQLSLQDPASVMAPLPEGFAMPQGKMGLGGSLQTIERHQDLRVAISQLLQPEVDFIVVLEQGKPLGMITLQSLRQASCGAKEP
jgi:osmoprotectant transport system ATP-binding protein